MCVCYFPENFSKIAYPDVTAPNRICRQSIPQEYLSIVSGREELALLWMRGESPHFVRVPGHDLLETQFESALEDGITGCAYQQLTLALRDDANGTQMDR